MAALIPDAMTENGALAFESTNSSILDFYGSISRSEKIFTQDVAARIDTLLGPMWSEDPLLMLKAIFHKRDAHEGSGEKAIFYHCLKWLAVNHFESFKKNLFLVPEFGYWKDLLSLLTNQTDIISLQVNNMVACLFADQLEHDLLTLNSLKEEKDLNDDTELSESKNDSKLFIPLDKDRSLSVSLCAKWAPSLKGEHDRKFSICSKIAFGMSYITKEQKTGKTIKWQENYRKILSSLREHLHIVEKNMCGNKWDDIKLEHVPSIAMHNYKKVFERRMSEKFTQWTSRIRKGESKVNAGKLMPHQFIEEIENGNCDDLSQLQWESLRKELADKGTFNNVLAVSDLSGSMMGIPMHVSIALGILISELTSMPFRNNLITFSESPSFFTFTGKTLMEKYAQLVGSNVSIGYNTNLHKTFQIILEKCITEELKKEDIPEKIIILTDGQFDMQTRDSDLTVFQSVKKMYEEKGYVLPTIIFWNLRISASSGMPVTKDENGTMMISGWSPNILKSVLNNTEIEIISPYQSMLDVLNAERYNKIRI